MLAKCVEIRLFSDQVRHSYLVNEVRLVISLRNHIGKVNCLNFFNRELVNHRGAIRKLVKPLLVNLNITIHRVVILKEGKLLANVVLLNVEVTSKLSNNIVLLAKVGRPQDNDIQFL